MIDRQWPHQVALRAIHEMQFQRQAEIEEFCRVRSVAPIGPSVHRGEEWYRIYCFERREDAKAFIERFGGEPIKPASRGTGRGWIHWREG